MNWVTIIWSTLIGACAAIAVPYLIVGIWQRRAAELFFVGVAVGTIGLAAGELGLLHATSAEEFGVSLRWLGLPIFLLVISKVGFVRLYFGTGRLWLGITVIAVRLLCLVMNFVLPVNLTFTKMTGLIYVPFWGEKVPVGIGVVSPWVHLTELSSWLMVAFVTDASISLWRKGKPEDRRRAITVGGSIVFFVLVAQIVVVLFRQGVLSAPHPVSLWFFAIVAAMAFELGYDLLRASALARQLRDVEERIALAAEAAHVGVWELNTTTNEMWLSDKARALFQFDADEQVTLAAFRDRVHSEDRALRESAIRRAIEANSGYEIEFRAVLPDGGMRWIGSHGRAGFDSAGKAVLVRGASLDITERKQAEQEALRLRQEVAHVGRVSMMGQLASALAHEINQPLGAILRKAEAAELFLQDASPDLDEIRAILADIRKDDLRAAAVIERMRTMLKRKPFETRALDVAELVHEVAGLAQGDAMARKVTLQVEVPAGLRPVRGDRVQLQQVLLNLILNGMDALSSGSPKDPRVMVRARHNGAHTVEIVVSDRGHGIPVEQLAHIFDPFFTTKPTGMGMGLPISRTIVEAHGGELLAENNEEGGATFRFTLKIAEVEAN